MPTSQITATFDPALTDAAGIITYWSGSSGVRVSELDAALKVRGLDLAPEGPSPETRVRRAVDAACPKGHIVRPSPNKRGRSVVREYRAEDRLRHHEVLRATWSGTGPSVEVFDETDELAMAVADEVRARFCEDADLLTAEDLLVWLSQRVVRTCNAVSLRRSGGMYFVPRSLVPLWRQIRDAVHEVGQGARIWEIPAMDGADAALAVLDALRAEAAHRIEEIEREIAGGELQRKALDARAARLEELAEKLQSYAEAMSLNVNEMMESVVQAQAGVTVAINALAKDEQQQEAA